MVALPAQAASTPPPNTPGGFSGVTSTENPNHFNPTQDATWLARKKAHLVHPVGKGTVVQPSCISIADSPDVIAQTVCPPPSSRTLYTGVVTNTLEPRRDHQNDANGNSFPDDPDMYLLCAPGATTNALYYWGRPVNSYGWHTVSDQYATTTWNDGNNRSYLMYIGWQIQPPNWSPGEMDTSHKPSGGVTLGEVRTALNWEASGHNTSTYANYYYATRFYGNSDATKAQLNSDVSWDIGIDGEAVQIVVNALQMPNWHNNPNYQHGSISHSITIIGYNNVTNQYLYTDTCGQYLTSIGGCGSDNNGGINTVSQDTLWNSVTSLGSGGSGWNF